MSNENTSVTNGSVDTNKLAKIIAEELKKDDYINDILDDYSWPLRRWSLNGRDTLRFKRKKYKSFVCILNEKNKSKAEIDDKKIEWTKGVLMWGGIRGNSKKTIIKYSTQSAKRLRNLSKGISSWSKVLAFRNPGGDFIYDYRVAFALNFILISHNEKISRYFFIPPSARTNSNSKSKYAYCNLISRLLGKINDGVDLKDFALTPQKSYSLYTKLIRQIIKILNDDTNKRFHLKGCGKQKVEMALFMKFKDYEKRLVSGD